MIVGRRIPVARVTIWLSGQKIFEFDSFRPGNGRRTITPFLGRLLRFGLITCAALPQRLHIAMGYILSCKICCRNKGRTLRSRRYGTIKPKNYLSRFQGPSKADSAYLHFWTVDRTEQSLRISYWRRRSIELLEIKGNNKFSRFGISG